MDKMENASKEDTEDIFDLVHRAYRTMQGWTLEFPFVGGERITHEGIRDLIERHLLFVWRKQGKLTATACIEKQEDCALLSLFSVHPDYQSNGVGKVALKETLNYIVQLGVQLCRIRVLEVRTELVNMYKKMGFRDTGERIPFVYPQYSKVGTLFFIVMEKKL